MNGIPPAKRLYCPEEGRETVHFPKGENPGGVPVRECRSCGNTRSGIFAAKPDVATIATDGGSSGGGGGDD